MNSQIQTMLERYECKNTQQYENALKEIIQEVALSGLSRAGFFSKSSFCGGTALRIFHGLDRFSEDLDFSLVEPDDSFDIKIFFNSVQNELLAYGFEMTVEHTTFPQAFRRFLPLRGLSDCGASSSACQTAAPEKPTRTAGLESCIEHKEKQNASAIKSAFLKGNTQKLLLQITSINPPVQGVVSTQKTRIKLEVDTNPPKGATHDERYALLPMPYQAKLMDLPSMLSGKIHAILYRDYVKGRDLYDYVWYLQHRIEWNHEFLKNALLQTNSIEKSRSFGKEAVKALLTKRFSDIDFDSAKRDVYPFLRNTTTIDVWGVDFFKQITENHIV